MTQKSAKAPTAVPSWIWLSTVLQRRCSKNSLLGLPDPLILKANVRSFVPDFLSIPIIIRNSRMTFADFSTHMFSSSTRQQTKQSWSECTENSSRQWGLLLATTRMDSTGPQEVEPYLECDSKQWPSA